MIVKLLLFNIIDFSVFVLGAFVFFSASLLFIDSWNLNKEKKSPLLRGIGFFLLSIVYAVYASNLETSLVLTITQIIKVLSLVLILYSLTTEPVLHKPTNKLYVVLLPLMLPAIAQSLVPLSAALFLASALWYLRRSTEGLDKQLKPAALALLFLSFAEFIRISFFKAGTLNVFWSKTLSTHASVWNVQVALQLIGIIILGLWVWGYIRFRIQIQLFATILASALTIFLVTTFFFSYLLIKNLENDALSHLKTDANVFQYALDRLQLESLSHAKSIAVDGQVREAVLVKDTEKLYEITSEFLLSQDLASLVITSSSGEIIVRAEDKENVGENLSDSDVIESALSGQRLSSLTINSRAIDPEIFIESAVPILNPDDNSIIGTVLSGFIVDNAFVDGVKSVTGLDATVFAGAKRAATTITSPDGKSRFVGTVETNEEILMSVLEKGETFVGTSEILNVPYYTAYTPLKAFGGDAIGMLFIGKPQLELLETAQQSINLTFLGSIALMVVSLLPIYFISKYIRENIEA